MERQKKFQVTLEFNSPCLYISNKESNIMKDLNNMYKNRCYGGYYITNIKKIINTSNARTINTNPTCICIVNVCFEADVKHYYTESIISDISVCIAEGQTCGSNEMTVVAFERSQNTQILVNEQIIPIRVGNKIEYKTNADRVGVMGSILLPKTKTTIYKIIGKLSLKANNSLEIFLEEISIQKDKITNESDKFIKLLNSYNNTTNNGLDIIKLIKDSYEDPIDVTGYWSKNLKTDCHLCLFNKSDKIDTDEYIEISIMEAFNDMLRDCVSTRQGIIDMTRTYKDSFKFNQCQNVWELMKQNKL